MGFSTLIDILGAMVLGGLMLLTIRAFNGNVNENSSKYHSDLIVQQNLVSIVELIEYDFSRLGYCEDPAKIPKQEDMIIKADSNSIEFCTDLAVSSSEYRGDGILDTLRYELGEDINNTPNPNDKLLYRYIPGYDKDASNLGITHFSIIYFDNFGNLLPHPINTQLIASMQIDIKVEDCYGYDTDNIDKSHSEKFQTALWRQIRLATKNISR
ncbi:MAG: hypothetical protein HYS24_12020 [Ignavibacteriales bacterium]|nr:hypothetical protein [Ignavibacteriales bacterium]MBK7980709.1 hypothetical protein [Ignavibacteriota bacterium]